MLSFLPAVLGYLIFIPSGALVERVNPQLESSVTLEGLGSSESSREHQKWFLRNSC